MTSQKDIKIVKILITDDDPNFAEILKLKLQKNNFSEIKYAKNGNEAIEFLKEYNPDLIILDVMMPEKNGIETAIEIKNRFKDRDLKFIFLTNYGEDIEPEGKEIDKKAAQEIGAVDFFRKTDSLDEIINKIKTILEINN